MIILSCVCIGFTHILQDCGSFGVWCGIRGFQYHLYKKRYNLSSLLINVDQSFDQVDTKFVRWEVSSFGGLDSVVQLMTCIHHCGQRPFYEHGLTLIPGWISNYIFWIVLDEITYPFPNINGATVEVWEWVTNFTQHFTMDAITYAFWD